MTSSSRCSLNVYQVSRACDFTPGQGGGEGGKEKGREGRKEGRRLFCYVLDLTLSDIGHQRLKNRRTEGRTRAGTSHLHVNKHIYMFIFIYPHLSKQEQAHHIYIFTSLYIFIVSFPSENQAACFQSMSHRGI
jgi:hypothetical protein